MALLFTVLSLDNVGLQVGLVGVTFVVGDLNLQLMLMIRFCWQEMFAYALLYIVVCVTYFLHNLWISLGYYFYH